ncbi:hypothetical protein [Hyphomicrobium sp.]|jgi:hypothetical protein|uniref:hypothetical protein n=1 Tax=Hyphomicrobium sp. TaxID=82 RepID=UPI0035654BFF
MKNHLKRTSRLVSLLFCLHSGAALSADLGAAEPSRAAVPASSWSLIFTTYGWIPWMSGNMTVKGRPLDVNVDPSQVFGHLDWSTLPAWMSYAEARRGPVGLFNDVVYASLDGSKGFAKALPGGDLQANVSVNYTQAIVEFGGAYEVWGGHNPVLSGSTAIDLIAGGRYWHQDTDVAGTLAFDPFVKETVRSGSVDWVDPFIGLRLRNQLGAGEELMVRADFGGFGVGSDSSWQVLATYNWQMCVLYGHVLDGYVGYRALSVDYSQGSGATRYEYDVLQQGPVVGSTLHF